ncbi:hypothetical protein HYFRA_00004154 [Hymenoscyphus fraxineus]|uniref:Cupin-type protein n=1 Tax=Hymenoscyphus fraxineus TaxID=746836 RepID=A0A9N9KLC1_9HELO|nr:hypothetical protein HYFRA_00004154 [Hymenoscyphus fraxineus]
MSGVSSWLQKMRKAELIDLCDHVDFKDYEGMRKTEVEVALDEYLTENADKYSGDSRLDPYYNTKRKGHSPVKRESASVISDLVPVSRVIKRRATRANEDFFAATDDSEVEPATTRTRSALARTPARSSALAFASSVPLPPSPAVVADAIDRRTAVLRSKVSNAYAESGIIETTQATRESLSSLVVIQALINLFEISNLRAEILPNISLFMIPAIKFLGTSERAFRAPDLFLLLTSSFWGPATLWAFTSFFVPLTAAYFFNLTAGSSKARAGQQFAYTFDPMTYNLVKALISFAIYGQDVTFGGLVDLEYVARINSSMYGGWAGPVVGSGIGMLLSVYEAVIRN